MSITPTPHHVGTREIAELLAWCQRLSAAGPDADPAERTAYLAAKTDLLTRITHPGPHPGPHPAQHPLTGHDHDPEEQR